MVACLKRSNAKFCLLGAIREFLVVVMFIPEL
jgi:hypothetical protein